LVAVGAVLGWIGGALVGSLARAGTLDRRSREWGLTQALARAGVYREPSQLARLVVVGWLAANFLGQAALIAAVNAGLPEARLLARAARWLVLLFAFATALT